MHKRTASLMANEPPHSDTAVLVDQTCGQLRSYVRRHPHAADTADGIRLWWLPDAHAPPSPAVLERALRRLEGEGLLASRMLPSGQPLWYAVPAPAG